MTDFLNILNEDVAEEIKIALPSWRGTPYRLEVAQIQQFFDTEGIDFDSLENDFEVWQELEKITNRSDVSYIVKDALKLFNIECNDTKFNRFKKETLIPFFFKVFDVYPKSATENLQTADAQLDTPDTADKPDKNSQLENLNLTPHNKLDISAIENFLPEKVADAEALKKLMTDCKEGKKIKDFFKKCCSLAGLELDAKKFALLTKDVYIPLFFEVFDIQFPEVAQKISKPAEPVNLPTFTLTNFPTFQNSKRIENPANFDINNTVKIYKNMPVTLSDRFWIKLPQNTSICYGCVALINADNNAVTAVGRLEDNRRDDTAEILPHLVFDSANIDYEQFKYQREYKVMLFPADFTGAEDYAGEIYLLECDIGFGELQTTTQPLCIDFGTSNTTAGTYGIDDTDDLQLVKFRDVTAKTPVETEMLPTVVYVDSFKNDEPVYKFGYEAKQEIIASDYSTKASVFYEIKRWINSTDHAEELFDKNGRTIPKKFTHEEIIKAYLKYVIATAEQQFKVKFQRLHFTAPVKLKSRFLNIVNKMFPAPEYSVEKEKNSLDEGVAVVYHYISQLLPKADEKIDTKSGDILILDCGGGTTDLASCHYEIKDSALKSSTLEIRTGFENGESNFGGNNITFRILQMLKIKIAAHLQRQGNLTMHALVEKDENAILSDIDQSYSKKDEIYKKFFEQYDAAEKFIPTKFAKYDGREERRKVKRNYYYLWQMAEAIKIEFYRSNAVVNVDFEKEQDKKIYVDDLSHYYLYVRRAEGADLEEDNHAMDKVEITIKEINRIICPDIYALLNTLLRQYTGDRLETLNKLHKFRYRLSGQSCKIALFHDLLKEFIPGVLLRLRAKNAKADDDSERLKKFCIEGSIEYMRAKAQGKIKPKFITDTPKNIYDVYIDDQCIFSHDGKITVVKGPNNMREATFVVKDSNKQIKRPAISYKFNFNQDESSRYDIDTLGAEIESNTPLEKADINDQILKTLRAIDLDRDNDGNSVCCVFTVPARDGYGFYIWQTVVAKDNQGKYYRAPKPQFETFEEESLHTFFNGDN